MTETPSVHISPAADAALSAMDYTAYEGRNTIRLFIQGFG